ncbi:hypothetical protein C8R44DRAFT_728471 [Mycena epipterygia]|nr:hypothetical protein C8R44DRAFT_728471 [Mycena epipterygia]
MPPTPLAPEVLDVIIDEVQERVMLKACSLAAGSFVVSSQRHLFQSLCLCMRIPSQRTPKGTDHLTVSMRSTPGIRTLLDYGVVQSALRIGSEITHLNEALGGLLNHLPLRRESGIKAGIKAGINYSSS